MKTLDRPLSIYRLQITTGPLGGQSAALVLVRALVFGGVEFLVGRELFEAQELKYEDPRRYLLREDDVIAPGMMLKDGLKYFVINSIDRDKVMMRVLASRKRDLEDSSS